MSVRSLGDALRELEARGETLATAESLTAGLVSSTVADIPGASAVLRGGLAAYASDVKVEVLGVDRSLVEREGVVSRACAEAMAVAGNRLFGTDWTLATTGVAGPSEQEGHPVGTVYVAVAYGAAVRSTALALDGDRAEVRRAAVAAAVTLLVSWLAELVGG
jgi:nicotinamide-nucleotide amidase